MNTRVRQLGQRYAQCFSNKGYLLTFVRSLALFLIGIVVTYYAIIYATENSSNPVTDLILNNIRLYDVDMLFLYGPVVFWVIVGIFVACHPKRIPFTLKSLGLFLLVRSMFLSLTHIAPFPTHLTFTTTGVWGVFTSGNDLFFSGHTGMPFLMALVFWENKYMRYFSILASIFFGTVVLMSHLHYSIDVFAAFFITYSIYKIAEKMFPSDHSLLLKDIS